MAKLGEANIGGRLVPAWLLNLTAEELDGLKWYSKPNLLDNWYFVGGGSQQGGGQFPINQRGQTSYTGITPTVDMWSSNSEGLTVTVQDEGISLSGQGYDYLREYLENPERFNGKTLTVSALVKNPNEQFRLNLYNETKKAQNNVNIPASSDWTLVTKTVDNFSVADGDKVAVLLYPGGGVPGQIATAQVAAAKLELGDHQTLAHQDEDGNWVLNEIPNFQQELAKCQRYYLPIDQMEYRAGQVGTNYISFSVPTPVTMRTNPVLAGTANIKATNGMTQSGFAISFVKRGGIARAYATKNAHGLTDAIISFESGSALSAEL